VLDDIAETWVPVRGYEGFYEVSNLGRVRSIDREFIRADGQRQRRRGRMLKQSTLPKGYQTVMLRHGKRRSVHRLVCLAFHGQCPGAGFEVAHFNGVPADNRAVNLRWATKSENQYDAIRHGTKKAMFTTAGSVGEGNLNARLTWESVREIRRRWADGGVTQQALAVEYGMGKSQINNIVHGRQWRTEWSTA
jgi:hypothetical protein